jgi:hypothetical protein
MRIKRSMKIRRRLFAILVAMLTLFPLAGSATTLAAHPWQPHIAIVWPHDGQGNPTTVAQSRAVNISVWPSTQVSCSEYPELGLSMAKDNEPTQLIRSSGQLIQRTVGGVTFPSLEFNNIPANLAAEPTAKFRFLCGSSIWAHAADPRTFYPHPLVPTGYCESLSGSLDPRIQIVWPHDEHGQFAPVERAPFVNIAVDLFEHGTLNSVLPEYQPIELILEIAEGNGPLTFSDRTAQKVTYTVGDKTYPRWVFNNVPVRPSQQYHFLVRVLPRERKTLSPFATIWTHARDARTILPHPQIPPPCVP